MHEKKKDYKCDICGKDYSSSHGLKCHIKTTGHIGAVTKRQSCDACGKTFNKESNIKVRSIYVSATISLATHYHNISDKAFIHTERYKRLSSNALLGFLL